MYSPDLRIKIFKVYVNSSGIAITKLSVAGYTSYSGSTGNITFSTPFVGDPVVLGFSLTASGVNGAFVNSNAVSVTSTYYSVTVGASTTGTASVSGYFTILGIV